MNMNSLYTRTETDGCSNWWANGGCSKVMRELDGTKMVAGHKVRDRIAEHAPERQDARWHYETRHLERLPLGTKYPALATRVAALQEHAEQAVRQRAMNRTYRDASVSLATYIDATGSIPSLDMFHERGIDVMPCFFNHGDRRTDTGSQVVIGKAWLVHRLQTLIQNDRLHIDPANREAAAMTRELMDYDIRVDEQGTDRYGAFRTGQHDHLVTALGLVAQWAPPDTHWMDDIIPYMNAQLSGL
jgi:hypothetical protein